MLIFLAGLVAADRLDLLQEVGGLEHVALLDLPHAVILPGLHMLRVDRERVLIPDLGELIVAELAREISELGCDIRMIVGIERRERRERRRVIAGELQRIGRAILVEELLLRFLLLLLGRS